MITLFNPKALVLAFAAFPETRDLAAAAILMLVFVLTATATGASWTLVGTWLRHGRLRDRGDCVAQLRTIGDSVTGVTGPARPAWESAVVAMTAAPPRPRPSSPRILDPGVSPGSFFCGEPDYATAASTALVFSNISPISSSLTISGGEKASVSPAMRNIRPCSWKARSMAS